jgi:uncharacterized protein
MALPTEQEIIDLHKKYAPNEAAYLQFYNHCSMVWEIAKNILNKNKLDIDEELVKVGCLLHDVGVYKLFEEDGTFYRPIEYLRHGILGKEIIDTEKIDERIGLMITRHIGMGITADEIKQNNLPLPHEDFIPLSLEEKLVCFADKFHSKYQNEESAFHTSESIKNHLRKYGQKKIDIFEGMLELFGEPNINDLAHKYDQAIR